MKDDPPVRASAHLKHLEMLRKHAAASARRFGCSAGRVREVELAVEEALVNIFNYAYGAEEGEVEIACRGEGDALLIEISDSGKPFDPLTAAAPEPAETLQTCQVGGMGLRILRRYADHLGYRRDGRRNILTIGITRKDDPC